MTAPSFTCPRCGRTSWNPNDAREQFCGACDDWTGCQCWDKQTAETTGRHEPGCPLYADEKETP